MTEAASFARARQRVGKVSVATKIFQGVGALPDVFKNFAFHTLLLFYYSQLLGLSPVRGRLYSSRAVFFTTPFCVAISRK